MRELRQNPKVNMTVVGLVDDNPDKQGMELHGVRVHGKIEAQPDRWRARRAGPL